MKITKNNNGTMLMSVLVGIGITVLLSTLSIPYLQKYQNNLKLSGVAKNIVSDLRLAQQLTISEQVVYQVEFDDVLQKYALVKTGAATTTIKSIDLPTEITYQSITSSLENKVVFNSFGGVSQSGSVVLQNSDSKTATINIKPSGYVQLSQ